MKCLFCEIANSKVNSFKVWENDDFFLFLDKMPINPGHLLLIPKKHYEYIFDLPDQDYQEIFLIAKKIVPALKKATSARTIGMAIEGLGMAHAHIHLVPINNGNELNPTRATSASDQGLLEMQAKLIKYLCSNTTKK